MKVLVVHNEYQQAGGEDSVVAAEDQALRRMGHTVIEYRRHNDELRGLNALRSLSAGVQTVWSSRSYADIERLLASEQPDVAHFHNIFPRISPSAYYACHKANVPVVQTLHNYRLLCPAATFFRQGRPCECCLTEKSFWPAIRYACYRSSRLQTAAVASMLSIHDWTNTWQNEIDVYVALSEFARRKFIEGGLSEDRMVTKPNFLYSDPGIKDEPGNHAIFIGRLTEEKGIRVVLEAWKLLREPVPLLIAGEGPLQSELELQVVERGLNRIRFLGRLEHGELFKVMKQARFLIFPSIWYEGFPMTLVESMACALPSISSKLGAMAEMIKDGCSGILFEPGSAYDLAGKVDWAWTHPGEVEAMGHAARAEYEEKYSLETGSKNLVNVYDLAIEKFRTAHGGGAGTRNG